MSARHGLQPDAYRRLVETIGIPLLVVDVAGTMRYVNAAAVTNLGWPRAQLLGRNVIEFTTPDAVATAVQSLADLVAHNEIGVGVPTVFPVLDPAGRTTWWAVGAVPLQDDPHVDGILLYFLPWDAQRRFDESLAALTAGEPLDDVFAHLGPAITFALEAVGASVHHDFDGSVFFGVSGAGVPDALLGVDGPWLAAVQSGEPVYAGLEALPEAVRPAAVAAGIGGCWAIPVPHNQGVAAAVLTVWRQLDMAPVTAHDFVISRSLRYVQLALIRHHEREQLAHMATHDGLTGTANRRLFRARLDEALTGNGPVAVLFCDLDRFKPVNDRHGHAAGDQVLVEVAGRLGGALGDDGLLARLGGDEFTVLLHGGEPEARAVAERLIRAVGDPITIPPPVGAVVHVGLSVGLAVGSPGSDTSRLLGRADAALYAAKGVGGNSIRVHGGS